VRSFLVLILVGTLGFLAGCGNSGTPSGVAISVTLTPSSASLTASQSVNITASVANDSSGKGVSWTLTGVGALSNQTTTGATYTAPATVTTTSIATVVATSIASPTSAGSAAITVSPAGATTNVVPISVNGGPLLTANPPVIYTNAAFISVEVCATSGACQTIPDILVDTGSFGLRVLGSELNSTLAAALTPLNDGNGNTVYDCVQFVDNSFLWGVVAPANILFPGSSETAPTTSIQVIANPSFSIPGGCSGTNEDTQALLGANGILGVGPEPFDCGTACDPGAGGTPPTVYYLCSSGGSCSTTFVSCGALCNDSNPNQQVTNPVFNFPTDNNGVILTLPQVNDVAATVSGTLTFGIGTEANNTLPTTATLFTLAAGDNFTTNYGGQALTGSFIDSGSNGLFFPQLGGSPAGCQDNADWYCPATTTQLTATNVDPNNGTTSNTVTFDVDNFDTVTNANPTDAAFSNIAGPMGVGPCSSSNTGACAFDWGLPFFYGRSVFTAIDGTTTTYGNGPFWAY
jgi:hypothetical protein